MSNSNNNGGNLCAIIGLKLVKQINNLSNVNQKRLNGQFILNQCRRYPVVNNHFARFIFGNDDDDDNGDRDDGYVSGAESATDDNNDDSDDDHDLDDEYDHYD